jgi:hypothetical protein
MIPRKTVGWGGDLEHYRAFSAADIRCKALMALEIVLTL